jgi:hypothetical protein
VKLPEAIVDAVHHHPGRAPAAGLIAHHSLHRDQWRDGGERLRERLVGPQVVGQRLAEESGRYDDLIAPTEPLDDQIAQAARTESPTSRAPASTATAVATSARPPDWCASNGEAAES